MNAALAIASALLGAAAFTPAIMLFVFYAPLACVFAALNQRASAWVVAAAALLAWLLSPVRFVSPLPIELVWLIAWVAGWSVLVVLIGFKKVRAARL